jgi:aminomethyltransferase
VSPLQLQGPQSGKIMQSLFGSEIADLKYYWCRPLQLDGIDLIVSRTGWSSELGYELFLRDSKDGDRLYETIMQAGQPFDLHPGHTSTIRRIEGGMLSYHADMDINTNPFELGLDRFVALDMEDDFVGKDALRQIKTAGVKRRQIGVVMDGPPFTQPNTHFWNMMIDGRVIGKVTSAVYSPRLEKNIALAMVESEHAALATEFIVHARDGDRIAITVEKPFYDPNKSIAKG